MREIDMFAEQDIIIALRRELHQCAELSMKETKTKKILMDFLLQNTSGKIIDRNSWFCCLIGEKKNGSPIAFRAENEDEMLAVQDALIFGGLRKISGITLKPQKERSFTLGQEKTTRIFTLLCMTSMTTSSGQQFRSCIGWL